MAFHTLLLLSFLYLVAASPNSLEKRDPAYRDSPTGSYAPKTVACPSNFAVRQPGLNGPLNPLEASYISTKSAQSVKLWSAFLSRQNLKGFNVTKFLDKANCKKGRKGTLPNFGFAVSGGGGRALLNGAAVLNGFDSRNPAAVKAKTGGVLQLANYESGLSGGGWATTSYVTSNFDTFPRQNSSYWLLPEDIFQPSKTYPTEYPDSIKDIALKKAAGFDVTLVDFYGRLLSYHFVNDSTLHGAATLWSGIKTTPNYKSRAAPFPIVVATSKVGGEVSTTLNNSIYEFTPVEFGTYSPSLNAFVPTENFGTPAVGGKATTCTVGFDNAGYIAGISSDIFGGLTPAQAASNPLVQFVTTNPGVAPLFAGTSQAELLDALVPNSFKGLGATSGYDATAEATLRLVDGGLALENIPFWPLVQPARALDAIIAVDSSNDMNGYPNGTEIYTTYLKSMFPAYNGKYPFPAIPESYYANSPFVQRGLNKRPVFFGCNARSGPLVVYLPNYNQTSPNTNTSTFKTQYSGAEINEFFDNGLNIATQQAGSTVDKNWSACLTCALIDKQNTRNGQRRTAQCQQCFTKYCA